MENILTPIYFIKDLTMLPLKDIQERELRLYVMITWPQGYMLPMEIPLGVALIASYDLDQAIIESNKVVPQFNLLKNIGYKPVREILGVIDVGGATVVRPETTSPEVQAEISFEQFRQRLLLARDQFCPLEDRKTLTEIIQRLKLKVEQKIETS